MAQQVLSGLYRIGFGGINGFLIVDGELVLVDAGLPKRAEKILDAVRASGRKPSDVRHILITHYHVDHIGSLAAVRQQATEATTYAHPGDAPVIREGRETPRSQPLGFMKFLAPIYGRFAPDKADPAPVDHEVKDGEELAAAGIRAIHTPGHTPGHTSYLWPAHGGVLFVGDAAGNWTRLGFPPSAENVEGVKESLRKIAALDFHHAVFGHGRAIKGKATAQFRQLVDRLAG
jgi:glyoxylase-like metal-dependent hydrolase (beta-lactamase superfamily II)